MGVLAGPEVVGYPRQLLHPGLQKPAQRDELAEGDQPLFCVDAFQAAVGIHHQG